jgi:hypothetical protein
MTTKTYPTSHSLESAPSPTMCVICVRHGKMGVPATTIVGNYGYCEMDAPSTPVIRYRTAEGCERCKTDAYVPHYNCLYHGNAMGHSAAHCTADACY